MALLKLKRYALKLTGSCLRKCHGAAGCESVSRLDTQQPDALGTHEHVEAEAQALPRIRCLEEIGEGQSADAESGTRTGGDRTNT